MSELSSRGGGGKRLCLTSWGSGWDGHFRHRTLFWKAWRPKAPKYELLVTSGSVHRWTPVWGDLTQSKCQAKRKPFDREEVHSFWYRGAGWSWEMKIEQKQLKSRLGIQGQKVRRLGRRVGLGETFTESGGHSELGFLYRPPGRIRSELQAEAVSRSSATSDLA